MNKLTTLLAAAILGLVLNPAWAQPDVQPSPPPAKPDKPTLDAPVPADQLDKVRAQTERGMKMLPTMLNMQLNLTDAQKESASKIVQDRWDGIGRENQDKLFSVMIKGRQLVESGQGTPEDFQRLAKDAQPVVESAFKMLSDGAADLEKILDEDQKTKLADVLGKFKQGQEAALERVKQVADGTVKLQANGEPEGGWADDARLGGGRRGGDGMQIVEEEIDEAGPDGVVRKVKVKRVKSKLPDEATVAGDEKYLMPYLKGYIAKYDLDADQQKTARRLLGESLTRAADTRKHSKQAFDDARKKIKEVETADNPQAVEAAHLAYDQLNHPIVTDFHDLQRQLDNLLTAQQRESGKNRGELFGSKDQAKDQSKGTSKDQPKIDPKGQ